MVQLGYGRAGMKTSISLNLRPQLLFRTLLPPVGLGQAPGSPHLPWAGGLLRGSKCLLGFQHLHSAATSPWPAWGLPLEELAARSPFSTLWPPCSRQRRASASAGNWPCMVGSWWAVKAASLPGRREGTGLGWETGDACLSPSSS